MIDWQRRGIIYNKNKTIMNFAFDYKFGNFLIPRAFILYSSKYFFAIAPPNQFLKGRNELLLIIKFKFS